MIACAGSLFLFFSRLVAASRLESARNVRQNPSRVFVLQSWQNNDCTNIENAMGEFCLCSACLFPFFLAFLRHPRNPRLCSREIERDFVHLFIYVWMLYHRPCLKLSLAPIFEQRFLTFGCSWSDPLDRLRKLSVCTWSGLLFDFQLRSVNNSVHLADNSIISTCRSTKHVWVSLR